MARTSELRKLKLARFREAAKIRDTQFQEEQLGSLATFYKDTATEYRKKAAETAEEYTKWNRYWEDAFTKASQAMQQNAAMQARDTAQRTLTTLGENYNDYLYSTGYGRFTGQALSQQEWQARRAEQERIIAEQTTTLSSLPNVYISPPVASGNSRRFRGFGSSTDANMGYVRDIDGNVIQISRLLTETGERRSLEDIQRADTSKRGNTFFYGTRAKLYRAVKDPYEENEKQAKDYNLMYEQEVQSLAQRNLENRQSFIAERQQQLSSLQNVQGSYRGATYTEKPI